MESWNNSIEEKRMSELLIWKVFAIGLLVILFIFILTMQRQIIDYNKIVCTNCVNDWLNRTGYKGLIP